MSDDWRDAYPPGTRAQFRVDLYGPGTGNPTHTWWTVVIAGTDANGVLYGHVEGDPARQQVGWATEDRWRLPVSALPAGVVP